MKKIKVFNLIILDESGSMALIENRILSGFEELIQSVQHLSKSYPDQEQYLSMVSFNSNGIKNLYNLCKVNEIQEFSLKSYRPSGMTPLYDAIGWSIRNLKEIVSTHDNYKVLVTILTDGAENCSKEFTEEDISQEIDALKQTEHWTFAYMGANQDSKAVAESLSIDNSLDFETKDYDLGKAFATYNNATASYMEHISSEEQEINYSFFKIKVPSDE